MVSSSVIRGLAFFATAMPLIFTSCATSDPKVFAHPVAVPPSPMPVVTAADGPVTSSVGSRQNQTPFLRAMVGVDADRLGRELGVARENLHQSNNFVFVAPDDSSQLPHIARLLEHTHGAFYEVFGGMKNRLAPPRSPLVWMLFDGRRDYENYARSADGMDMSWSKAYYSTQTNRVAISLQNDGDRVVVNTATTTATGGAAALPLSGNDKLFAQITHEAGHQLAFNSGLQTRGVMYPLWASEGLAANFEMDANGQLGPAAQNVLRSRHLIIAIEDDRLIPLEHWVGYARVPIGRPAQINAVYSQSWAFFRFLYEHRRDHLHDYLAHMAKQQPGRRSEEALRREFAVIFGDPKELHEPWNAYLTKMKEANRLATAQATTSTLATAGEEN